MKRPKTYDAAFVDFMRKICPDETFSKHQNRASWGDCHRIWNAAIRFDRARRAKHAGAGK